jgi:N utilization substance protein A
VDIRSESEFAAEEAESGYEEEELAGRCAAVLSNGRRCPNAALPSSRYCGLESHQALASIPSDNVADLAQSEVELTPEQLDAASPSIVEVDASGESEAADTDEPLGAEVADELAAEPAAAEEQAS